MGKRISIGRMLLFLDFIQILLLTLTGNSDFPFPNVLILVSDRIFILYLNLLNLKFQLDLIFVQFKFFTSGT